MTETFTQPLWQQLHEEALSRDSDSLEWQVEWDANEREEHARNTLPDLSRTIRRPQQARASANSLLPVLFAIENVEIPDKDPRSRTAMNYQSFMASFPFHAFRDSIFYRIIQLNTFTLRCKGQKKLDVK